MKYPGGKNRVYQTIINQMPPHQTYIEGFLGSGAVMRHKRPAHMNIGLDLCEGAIQEAAKTCPTNDGNIWSFERRDAIQWLQSTDFGYYDQPDTLVYLDPPYPFSTRSSQRPIYDYEMTDDDHELLLSLIVNLNCYVMISSYWSEMYHIELHTHDWRFISFQTYDRAGNPKTEYLWMNYPEPTELHDYSYLGDNYRERERIKRKKQRWVNKLEGMDVLERRAILWAIRESGIAINNDDTGLSARIVKSNGKIRHVPPKTTM